MRERDAKALYVLDACIASVCIYVRVWWVVAGGRGALT